MVVNIAEVAIDGVQALVHAGLNLIPFAGPVLGKVLGLVL